jgi:hypothetical protein
MILGPARQGWALDCYDRSARNKAYPWESSQTPDLHSLFSLSIANLAIQILLRRLQRFSLGPYDSASQSVRFQLRLSEFLMSPACHSGDNREHLYAIMTIRTMARLSDDRRRVVLNDHEGWRASGSTVRDQTYVPCSPVSRQKRAKCPQRKSRILQLGGGEKPLRNLCPTSMTACHMFLKGFDVEPLMTSQRASELLVASSLSCQPQGNRGSTLAVLI